MTGLEPARPYGQKILSLLCLSSSITSSLTNPVQISSILKWLSAFYYHDNKNTDHYTDMTYQIVLSDDMIFASPFYWDSSYQNSFSFPLVFAPRVHYTR